MSPKSWCFVVLGGLAVLAVTVFVGLLLLPGVPPPSDPGLALHRSIDEGEMPDLPVPITSESDLDAWARFSGFKDWASFKSEEGLDAPLLSSVTLPVK